MMKKYKNLGSGVFVGVINSLLGAGGGMIAVPILKHNGLSQNKAQASAIAVIFPLTVISSIIYILSDKVNLSSALPYLPGGVLGSLLGAFLLPKVPENILRKIFAVFMIWAGVRLFLK